MRNSEGKVLKVGGGVRSPASVGLGVSSGQCVPPPWAGRHECDEWRIPKSQSPSRQIMLTLSPCFTGCVLYSQQRGGYRPRKRRLHSAKACAKLGLPHTRGSLGSPRAPPRKSSGEDGTDFSLRVLRRWQVGRGLGQDVGITSPAGTSAWNVSLCTVPRCAVLLLGLQGLGQVPFSWGMPHRGWAPRMLSQHWVVKGATRGPKKPPVSSNKTGLPLLCALMMPVT